MAVHRTDYVMIAIRLDPVDDKIDYKTYQDIEDDPYDPKYEGAIGCEPPLKMVFDGMDKKYVYFGWIVGKDTGEGDGFGLMIGTALPAMWAKDVDRKIKEMKIPNPDERIAALHIFSHWH